VAKVQGEEELPEKVNDFSVKGGVGVADSLTTELVVLSVSSCLGSVVSENGGKIIQLYRLGQVVEPVFDVGAAH